MVPPPPPRLPACHTRYIGPDGSDVGNSGCSVGSPLATLAACVAESVSGDTCLFLPGTYSTSGAAGLTMMQLSAFTIGMAPATVWPQGTVGTEAIIDGTTTLSGWTQLSDAHGTYLRSDVAYSGDSLPWQIFVNGAPLTPARWPNAPLWTAESWDRDATWARQTYAICQSHPRTAAVTRPCLLSPLLVPSRGRSAATCGQMVDGAYGSGADLAATGISFNGCNAIVNNEHWVTRRYSVENHTAGTAVFDYAYNPSIGFCSKYYNDATNNRYFLDGCLAAFDAPGEWAVDATGRVLLRLPSSLASMDISSLSIRGKVQTYAIAALGCDDLVVEGLTFFATALLIYDSRRPTLRGCTFSYASASRRSLGGSVAEFDGSATYGIPSYVANYGLRPQTGSYEISVPTVWIGRQPSASYYTEATVVDNEVRYSDGPGIACANCGHDTIENNLVEHAGYPFGRGIQLEGLDTTFVTVRRNTLDYSGSGAIAWLWGPSNLAEVRHA